jgi:hypothetical protein
MIARFRKYRRIITRCAHQVFGKSRGNLAMFTAIRRVSSRVGHALNRKWARSALGQKRTSRRFQSMSALPPEADIVQHGGNVRFVPKDGVIGRRLVNS